MGKNFVLYLVLFYFSCVSVILKTYYSTTSRTWFTSVLVTTKTTLASTRTIQFHAHTCARPCSMYVCVHVQLRVVPVV